MLFEKLGRGTWVLGEDTFPSLSLLLPILSLASDSIFITLFSSFISLHIWYQQIWTTDSFTKYSLWAFHYYYCYSYWLLTFIERSLWIRYPTSCFPALSHLTLCELSLFPLYPWGKWGSERLIQLLLITVKSWTQVSLSGKYILFVII